MSPRPADSIFLLGTRGSLLAQAQSAAVARLVEQHNPGVRVELTIFKTTGDSITDKPLHAFGGKGLFTRELEQALLAGTIDFAVHSFKDMPVTMPLVEQSGLVVAAVPEREDPRDVLVSLSARSPLDLVPEARVGTGSLRRRCQLIALRPTIRVEGVRGNIDTRLRKLRDGAYDAIVLAAAGLKRAGLFDNKLMTAIAPELMLPAPGQGALALQCRADDDRTRAALRRLDHPSTAACVRAERAVVSALQGDCLSPIAAWAVAGESDVWLRAVVGARGGEPPLCCAEARAPTGDAAAAAVCKALLEQGVLALLHGNPALRESR